MKVTFKLINAYSQGAHSFPPCNLRASIKDLNLIQNTGLGLIATASIQGTKQRFNSVYLQLVEVQCGNVET